jgi:hypothetical protein
MEMEREGGERDKKSMTCGPAGVGLYGVGDLVDDGCGEIGIVLQNFDDQAEYSLLGDAFGL